MLRLLFLMALLMQSGLSLGQAEIITAGAPGIPFVPYTVGKSVFLVQSGYNFSNFSGSTQGFIHDTQHTFRYGLTSRLDLRLDLQLAYNRTQTERRNLQELGVSLFHVGGRYLFTKGEQGKFPAVSLQTEVKLPADDVLGPKSLSPQFLLLAEHTFTPKHAWALNAGIDWVNFTSIGSVLYGTTWSFTPTPEWAFFGEAYGSISTQGVLTNWFDAGIDYFPNPDLVLEITVGYGENRGETLIFINPGLAYRIR